MKLTWLIVVAVEVALIVAAVISAKRARTSDVSQGAAWGIILTCLAAAAIDVLLLIATWLYALIHRIPK